MKKRIWVVIAQFNSGTWDIADFTTINYSSTHFRTAHMLKRQIFDRVKENAGGYWTKDKFRVIAFQSGGKFN